MCLRSQAGVRWKTLLNYITVAFQRQPARHWALFPLCVPASGVLNTCGFCQPATSPIMMLALGSMSGTRWKNRVLHINELHCPYRFCRREDALHHSSVF